MAVETVRLPSVYGATRLSCLVVCDSWNISVAGPERSESYAHVHRRPVPRLFIGYPIVMCFAMMAAALWCTAIAAIVCAWACTAATIAAVSFARRLLDSRSSRLGFRSPCETTLLEVALTWTPRSRLAVSRVSTRAHSALISPFRRVRALISPFRRVAATTAPNRAADRLGARTPAGDY